ncbi:MAG: Unknown protein [uncultured Sulfurovum sp.]|uniref:diguanylate cyclase n=1 Tax=uncultured Sulfurovum sp. TaxID=269237 RepID=A0A6S6TPH1_9BACT|nr:MAG: Unknown protein [uncultured Sulfurovum sp.]
MSEFTLYAAILLVVLILALALFIYKIRANKIIQTFLNSHDNILILSDRHKINMINDAGLKVFGYESLKSFLLSNVDISNSFINNEIDNDAIDDNKKASIPYIDRYSYGKNWIDTIARSPTKQVKVKIFSKEDLLDQNYQITVSKLKFSNQYSLSFTNISQLEAKRLSIKKQAEYDPLTNIYNRVKLDRLLRDISFDVKKFNQEATLILFDIDHFKSVNDDYGHNVGDSVLIELSGLVRISLRPEDIFARWGGEEFVILLKNTSLKETTALASRLRQEIEKFHFSTVKDVTCSFGVTEFRAGDTERLLFKRVDEALYEAKENGRNQVVTK